MLHLTLYLPLDPHLKLYVYSIQTGSSVLLNHTIYYYNIIIIMIMYIQTCIITCNAHIPVNGRNFMKTLQLDKEFWFLPMIM